MSLAMTQAGMILGTAAYMAPEQARGKSVDKRADIWAFGVVLYEMLTGRQLFGGGETIADTLASVVKDAPDLKALPADTPLHIRRLLGRCLQKDPLKRLRDIGEARIAFDAPAEPAPVQAARARRSWIPWAVAAVALAALPALWFSRSPAPSTMSGRFTLPMPPGTQVPTWTIGVQAAPSPDGRRIAFTALEAGGATALWVRDLDSLTSRRLERTDGANFPFWSPDSQFIGFFAEDKLKKISVSGAALQSVADVRFVRTAVEATHLGATWNRDGVIVFSPGGGPLMRTTAEGGQSVPAANLEAADVEHSWPQFLEDGKHILYYVESRDPAVRGSYVQELGSSKRVQVMRGGSRVAWAPPGRLLFVREGTLFAQRSDPQTFQLTGQPVALAQDVVSTEFLHHSSVAASEGGVLVYRSGVAEMAYRQLRWLDRSGKPIGDVGKPGPFSNMALSPDEKTVAVTAPRDLWTVDVATGVSSHITSGGNGSLDIGPWSPDSQRVAFNIDLGGVHEVTVANRKSTVLPAESLEADAWTPDGQSLLCIDPRNPKGVVLLPLGEGARPQTIAEATYHQLSFRLSPDGKFVAYSADESGRLEVFVASFPDFAQKRQISNGGAGYPYWRADGKELYYRQTPTTLVAVPIRLGATIEVGAAQRLFDYGLPGPGNRFAVSADGRRFLIMDYTQKAAPVAELVVMLNWTAGLKP
jgi:Tol biopolymer transport system component